MKALHELPGATYSNPKERGDYASKDRATMTLAEIEQWLTEYIMGIYHTRQHRAILASPLQRWTASVFANNHAATVARPVDDVRIRLDFLPFAERTVQPYGVAIDGIGYYSDVLRRFIGATEGGGKRSFVFRRDPRDISTIYFWDAALGLYSAIPYRNTTHPAISVWELRELRSRLVEAGRFHVDGTAMFEVYARLREHEARATTQTKRVRRARARRRIPNAPIHANELIVFSDEPDLVSRNDDIEPFPVEEF